MFDNRDDIDFSKDKVGDESDGEEYFRMNVGYDKYHPVGPTCTYKGKKIPCLVQFSEVGGISGHTLPNVLRHLDALKLYDNNRKNSIIPVLSVDGHDSCSDLVFLKYICDGDHKHTVVFGVTYVI